MLKCIAIGYVSYIMTSRFTGYKNTSIFKNRNKCFVKRFLTAYETRPSNSTFRFAYCHNLLPNAL